MAEGGGEDGGEIVAGLGHSRLQAGQVVVVAEDLVRPVRLQDAGRARGAPGGRAVIGAPGADDGLPAGLGPGDGQGHGRRIAAVLAE